MSKFFRKITFIFFLIFICAATVSHASIFAEFGDEEADSQAKNELIQQQEEDQKNAGKSSNNYLSTLSVEGYILSPEFDRQTINYEIKGEITNNTIKVNATSDDSRATVSGIGEIELQEGENNLRIDVVAENGTTRTYFIKVNGEKSNEDTEETTNVIEEENIASYETELTSQEVATTKKTNGFDYKIILYVIFAIVIFVIIIFAKRNSKKYESKH